MGHRLIREIRGRLALWLTLAFVVATAGAAVVGQLMAGAAMAARIVYIGSSLLVVTLVLMFGVGKWSRYLPQDKGGMSSAPYRDAGPATNEEGVASDATSH